MRVATSNCIQIPSQYDLLTVLELVELIEQHASELVAFSLSVLNAAHGGLLKTFLDPDISQDAGNWDLQGIAEKQLASQQGEDLIPRQHCTRQSDECCAHFSKAESCSST